MSQGTPAARVYPMYALGSTVLEVDGAIDRIIDQVIETCREQGLYLSSTSRGSNPYQGEGNKTIAYEVVEQLGRAPDCMVVPVGGGGTIAGILRGFQDLQALGHIGATPRMIGVVPKDYNILEVAFERGLETWDEVLQLDYDERPPSLLVKLAHNYPPDGMEAIEAVRASRGFFLAVSDEDALQAQERVGRTEGLYIEPSTGACLAGVQQLLDADEVQADDVVVALVSGSGYRETMVTMEQRPLRKLSITADELAATLAGLAP
jgi:threonine synthase